MLSLVSPSILAEIVNEIVRAFEFFRVFGYFYKSNKLCHSVKLIFLADSGGDEKEAKKLSKEMRQELVRAKSNLGEQCE